MSIKSQFDKRNGNLEIESCAKILRSYLKGIYAYSLSQIMVQKKQPEVLCKKRCSEKLLKFHRTCVGVFFLIKLQYLLYYKEAPTQMLSHEICEIFKNIYFEEYLRTTASGVSNMEVLLSLKDQI